MVFGVGKMSTIKLYPKICLISFIFFVFNLFIVNAHLAGGIDKELDGYIIDLSFDPKEPQKNQKTVFAISLFNETTQEVIESTKVWVRISSSKDVVFAGTFKPELQNIAFSYTFPESGSFEISTKFFDNENLIVEADFDLNVKGKIDYSNIIILFLFLIIIVMILKSVLFKPKKV